MLLKINRCEVTASENSGFELDRLWFWVRFFERDSDVDAGCFGSFALGVVPRLNDSGGSGGEEKIPPKLRKDPGESFLDYN